MFQLQIPGGEAGHAWVRQGSTARSAVAWGIRRHGSLSRGVKQGGVADASCGVKGLMSARHTPGKAQSWNRLGEEKPGDFGGP